MIHKEYTKDEVFIYMNGRLLYKRWLRHDYGRTFCYVWGGIAF